ncbi:MAG TPA: hypothetical protein HA263_04935 [Methanoregulaceae archaeon]|nr:hypothetical protein [Methanoregulaceae archaeon]
MRAVVGSAGRADDADEIEIRIAAPVPRVYRVLAADVRQVLAGYPAVLYSVEGEPVGDVATSASGRVLLGASRAGLGFVLDNEACQAGAAAWMVVRDHFRAHYYRHDGPVEVLEAD